MSTSTPPPSETGPPQAEDPPGLGGSGWTVYLLRCADGTLYCGCTNDLARRLVRHHRGAVKYTRGRLPVAVAYSEAVPGRSAALRREAAIKRLSRARKLGLCRGEFPSPGKR